MKSPITGKEMERRSEVGVEMTFRKENFNITHHYWLCTETGEQFTDEAMDALDLGQVYNQYREKYGIPFPEEIKLIREKYGTSASKMSEILGFGTNSWRQYEAGEIPSVSNGRLILAVKDSQDFIRQVEASTPLLSEKEKAGFLKQSQKLINEELETRESEREKITVFRKTRPNQFNGYRIPNLEKAAQMILFFSSRMKPLYKTKLNKLLFYADFQYFSNHGQSISGMEYRAIQHGPVPADYDKLLVRLSEDELIAIEPDADNFGETVQPKKGFDSLVFSTEELAVLDQIENQFKKITAKQIVEISHQEEGWKANVEGKGLVSYREFGWGIKTINRLHLASHPNCPIKPE